MANMSTAPILTKHPDYTRLQTLWSKCRDAASGEDAVHAKGQLYLPALADQTPIDYAAYNQRACFFNATYRTIDGLRGMVFRRPPQMEVPNAAKQHLEDVDLSGRPLPNFLKDLVEDTLTVGKVGILVDYPTVKKETLTQADAAKLNLRPTMVMYKTEAIFNWRYSQINNKTALSHVVLEECIAEPDGDFGSKERKQYRVLDLFNGQYRVRIFELTQDGASQKQISEDIFPEMDNQRLTFIPFFMIGEDDEPPLLDLVNVNLAHYRVSASYEHGCHFTGCPTPVVSGYTPADPGEKLYIGSRSAWIFRDPNAKASYLEFTGEGLGALERNLSNKEQQMAVLGARMLEPQKREVETAEAAELHRSGENSMLASYAQMISAKVEDALEVFSAWAGAKVEEGGEAVEFALNREFYPATLRPDELKAVVATWQAGGMSKESLFTFLQNHEVIPKERTYEEEEAKIDAEGPKLSGGLGGTLPPQVEA